MIQVNKHGVKYFDSGDGVYICTYHFGDGYEKTITLIRPSQRMLDNLNINDFVN
jgi:hypothetical protein